MLFHSVFLAYYIHDFSPILFKIPFTSFAVHWYGLAYVLGFVFGILLLKRFARKGWLDIPEEKVTDFITYTALFGVMLGGRLGYMLYYDRPHFLANPWSFFMLSQGGMASHGGILGIFFFVLWYSWKHKVSWANLGDALVVAAPIGIFFGRIANFINGELFGRETTVPWAVQFPTELYHSKLHFHFFEALAPYHNFIYGTGDTERLLSSSEIMAQARVEPGLLTALQHILTPRHPSQIYEALLEGVFLFVVLYLIRTCVRHLPNGILTGLFFILYAVVRILGEEFREPDDGSSLVLGLTNGQFLSTFMIVIGLGFVIWGLTVGKARLKKKEAMQEVKL